jgi:hypothetical protein
MPYLSKQKLDKCTCACLYMCTRVYLCSARRVQCTLYVVSVIRTRVEQQAFFLNNRFQCESVNRREILSLYGAQRLLLSRHERVDVWSVQIFVYVRSMNFEMFVSVRSNVRSLCDTTLVESLRYPYRKLVPRRVFSFFKSFSRYSAQVAA